MDRRRRTSSATSKGLLSRQLASITDTLAKAAQRRDETVKRVCRPSRASTAATELAPASEPVASRPVTEPGYGLSKTAPAQLRGGAEDGEDDAPPPYVLKDGEERRDRMAEEERHKEMEEFHRRLVEMEVEDARQKEEGKRFAKEQRRIKVKEDARVADKIEGEEEVLLRAECDAAAAELARWAEKEAERAINDKERLASVQENTMSDPSMPSMRGGDVSPFEDDLRVMLAELRNLERTARAPQLQIKDEDDGRNDIKRMFAELNRPSSQVKATVMDDDRNAGRMLVELDTFSAPSSQEGIASTNEDNEDDADINTLWTRLQNLRSVSSDCADTDGSIGCISEDKTVAAPATRLHSQVVPYVIALKLEQSNTQWEIAQGWTTYLFSSGLDSYEAQKEKQTAATKAENTLKGVIDSVMQVEEDICRKEEQTKLHRRLIVSNLAAGADEEALERAFWEYRNEMQGPQTMSSITNADSHSVDIVLLPERDPLKRTQTAYIDMSSRKAVIQASYTTGEVYGLIFNVKLAVEQND